MALCVETSPSASLSFCCGLTSLRSSLDAETHSSWFGGYRQGFNFDDCWQNCSAQWIWAQNHTMTVSCSLTPRQWKHATCYLNNELELKAAVHWADKSLWECNVAMLLYCNMFMFSFRTWSCVQKYVPHVSSYLQQEIIPYISYISLLYVLLKENSHVNIPECHWGLCQCLLSLRLHLTVVWWGFAGGLRRSWDIVRSWAGRAVLRLVPQGDIAATFLAALSTTPTEMMVFS